MYIIAFALPLFARSQFLSMHLVENPMTPLVMLDYVSRHYPDATPYWRTEGQHCVVMFVDPATSMRHIIHYDRHGTILRSEHELDTTMCPTAIRRYYASHMPGKAYDLWSYEDAAGKKFYLKRRSREVWFDEFGNFMQRRRVLW